MGLCVLTHNQIKVWQDSGTRPDCAYHRHTTYKKILGHLLNDEAIFYSDKRAVVIYDCVLRYEWRGRKSGKFSTLQLVPVGT